MTETRKAKKKKKTPFFSRELDLLRTFRFLILIFLAFFLVYLYYLHTKGILSTTVNIFWIKHQKMIEMIAGITTYSAVIYYLGYQKGKKG